jgi:hypothetical protein
MRGSNETKYRYTDQADLQMNLLQRSYIISSYYENETVQGFEILQLKTAS